MEIWQHIWQVLAALGGTVALIYLLAFVAKRMQSSVKGQGHRLSVLETLHLSAKERLMLVQVGEQHVLIGVTAQQITQLAEVPVSDVLSQVQSAPESHNLSGAA